MRETPDIVKQLKFEEENGILNNEESVSSDNNYVLIKTNEDRFKRFIEKSSDFIAEVDEKGIFLYSNPAMAKSLNTTVDELIGRSIYDVLPADVAKRRAKLAKKALESGQTLIIEDKRNNRYFNNIFTPSIDNEGNKTIQVIARDITRFKEVEYQLEESLNHFKNLFNCIVDPIVIIDSKGKILEMNENMSKSTGYDREDFIGKNVFKTKIFTNKTKRILIKNLLKRMTGIKINPYEIELLTKKGEKITFEINAKKIKYKNNEADLVVFRDVSQRKKMQEKLKLSEDKYSDLFEHSNDLIQSINPDGSINYVNNAWKKAIGYTDIELSNISIFDIIHPNDLTHCKNIFNELLNGKKIGRIEVSYLTKEGNKIDLEGSINCKFKDGKPIATRGIFRDISQRKSTENRLKEKINELEKAQKEIKDLNQNLGKKVEERTSEVKKLLKHKDEFIKQLGHDLKTPLTPITTLLPIIKEKVNDKKLEEMLEMVILNANYMSNLVIKTLKLAKLNSPYFEIETEEINLKDLLNDFLDNKKYFFKTKNIHLVNEIYNDIIIKGDKILLTELFDNIISNSIKYGSKKNKKIKISCNINKNDNIIIIEDNGIGMSKDQINHIFNEFYKADDSRHEINSSGLGLNICKKIIEILEGKILIESPGIGKGTIVYLTFKKYK